MATFVGPSLVPYGEGSAEIPGGYAPSLSDQCEWCGHPFEIDDDGEAEIPHESSLGNYCSGDCKSAAMFKDASESDRRALVDFHKALMAISDLPESMLKHLAKWDDMDGPYARMPDGKVVSLADFKRIADEFMTAIDPEGGVDWPLQEVA